MNALFGSYNGFFCLIVICILPIVILIQAWRYKKLKKELLTRELNLSQVTHGYQKELHILQEIVSKIQDLIVYIDHSYIILSINDVCASLFQKNSNDIVGYPLSQLIGDKLFQKFRTEWIDPCLSGQKQTNSMWFQFPNDRSIYLDIYFYPIRIAPDNEISGVVIHARDITQIKQSDEAFLKNEILYHSLFDNMKSGVAIYRVENDGQDFIFIDYNHSAEKMDNTKKEQLLNKNVVHVYPGVIEFGLYDVFKQVWKTGEPHYHPISLYKDEKLAAWRDNYVLKLETGEIVAIYDDITERKRLEFAQQRLNTMLTSKNKELEQIIYVTSHDLRSPLVNIQGFSKELEYSIKEIETHLSQHHESIEQLKDTILLIVKKDIQESLTFILKSISKMDSLLSGLLKLSRLGRAAIKKSMLNMNQLFSNISAAYEYHIRSLNITLKIKDLPDCYADDVQVNQIFSNLLDNAIKFLKPNDQGNITIWGYTEQDQSIYCIEDNGIGIDPNHQEIIFEIFHRLDPEFGKGEGLGLTIVTKIVDRLNGKVWVNSELGKGCKFFVSLPNKMDKSFD